MPKSHFLTAKFRTLFTPVELLLSILFPLTLNISISLLILPSPEPLISFKMPNSLKGFGLKGREVFKIDTITNISSTKVYIKVGISRTKNKSLRNRITEESVQARNLQKLIS